MAIFGARASFIYILGLLGVILTKMGCISQGLPESADPCEFLKSTKREPPHRGEVFQLSRTTPTGLPMAGVLDITGCILSGFPLVLNFYHPPGSTSRILRGRRFVYDWLILLLSIWVCVQQAPTKSNGCWSFALTLVLPCLN